MELKLYDTLTREKRVFAPLDPARVRMYVCGPTVYDFAHIGNARPVIVFDVLFRLLRHLYGAEHVTYVRNITDVDDKINARAAQDFPDLPLNEAIREVTEKTDKQFHEDVAALGCLPPTVEPRATEHIAEMKTLIERLIAHGCAYVAEDHVLFSVSSMKDYGKLSKRSLDEMVAGARVEVAPYKRDPMDFVLWKPSKPGEPAWPSPAGIMAPGRPGWHIECSAMSWKHLGETFDIHGGGIDLVFPHHENEIAQTRCAFHSNVMANFWMHNGFLQVEGEKMSKSLGNFVTIRELLRGWKGQPWSGAAVRWAMLQTHYRQPIDWTYENLLAARKELSEFFIYLRTLDHNFENQGKNLIDAVSQEYQPSSELVAALSDDLNTPAAIAVLRRNKTDFYRIDKAALQALRDLIFLGLVSEPTRYILSMGAIGENWPADLTSKIAGVAFDLRIARANSDREFENVVRLDAKQIGVEIGKVTPAVVELNYICKSAHSIDDLVAARTAARKARNFKEADRIRDELAVMGVVLKDSKDGTTWEIAR